MLIEPHGVQFTPSRQTPAERPRLASLHGHALRCLQYCERNGVDGKLYRIVREVNCMYTQHGRRPLLMSAVSKGNAPVHVLDAPNRSAALPSMMSRRAIFSHSWTLTELRATSVPGQLEPMLRSMGLNVTARATD